MQYELSDITSSLAPGERHQFQSLSEMLDAQIWPEGSTGRCFRWTAYLFWHHTHSLGVHCSRSRILEQTSCPPRVGRLSAAASGRVAVARCVDKFFEQTRGWTMCVYQV